jgi:excisionase family DNA binding protein
VNLEDLLSSRSAVVTLAQAASVFGVDVRTVTRAIENGDLPALRLGRRVLIPWLPLLAALGVRVDDALTDAQRHQLRRPVGGVGRRLDVLPECARDREEGDLPNVSLRPRAGPVIPARYRRPRI